MGKEFRISVIIIAVIAVGSFVVVKALPRETSSEILVTPLPTDESSTDILAQTPSIAPLEEAKTIYYYALTLASTSTSPLEELEEVIGGNNVRAVLKLNRIDSKFLRRGDTLTVPLILGDFKDLSPFPRNLPIAEPIPKLLLISRRIQAFGVYESGKLVRWGPVSTGTESTPTPANLYSANWKAEITHSTVNYDWVLPWTINILNYVGIDIHQYDLPGYPASHSCIRMVETDAKWLYDWIDLWVTSADGRLFRAHGTPVLIFGNYAYDETAPWKDLPYDPTATTVSLQELETEFAKHMETIENRQQQREKITGVSR